MKKFQKILRVKIMGGLKFRKFGTFENFKILDFGGFEF
jgi:hypothetical protein